MNASTAGDSSAASSRTVGERRVTAGRGRRGGRCPPPARLPSWRRDPRLERNHGSGGRKTRHYWLPPGPLPSSCKIAFVAHRQARRVNATRASRRCRVIYSPRINLLRGITTERTTTAAPQSSCGTPAADAARTEPPRGASSPPNPRSRSDARAIRARSDARTTSDTATTSIGCSASTASPTSRGSARSAWPRTSQSRWRQ